MNCNEKQFTLGWWKELFKRGKPLGDGGIELRDEDKYYYALQTQHWFFALARDVSEKFGEEGEKVVADSFEKSATETWKLLFDAIDKKPKNAAEVASLIGSFDANAGSEVVIRNVSSDKSTAELFVPKCTAFDSGLTTKDACLYIGPIMGKAIMNALGPIAEKVEIVEVEIDPPNHCTTRYRMKE